MAVDGQLLCLVSALLEECLPRKNDPRFENLSPIPLRYVAGCFLNLIAGCSILPMHDLLKMRKALLSTFPPGEPCWPESESDQQDLISAWLTCPSSNNVSDSSTRFMAALHQILTSDWSTDLERWQKQLIEGTEESLCRSTTITSMRSMVASGAAAAANASSMAPSASSESLSSSLFGNLENPNESDDWATIWYRDKATGKSYSGKIPLPRTPTLCEIHFIDPKTEKKKVILTTNLNQEMYKALATEAANSINLARQQGRLREVVQSNSSWPKRNNIG